MYYILTDQGVWVRFTPSNSQIEALKYIESIIDHYQALLGTKVTYLFQLPDAVPPAGFSSWDQWMNHPKTGP